MSRHRGEIQVGSDSFLDVVCNFVGILIILMVVAGVRADRMPVDLPLATIERLKDNPVSDAELQAVANGGADLKAADVLAGAKLPTPATAGDSGSARGIRDEDAGWTTAPAVVPPPTPFSQESDEPVVVEPPADLVELADRLKAEASEIDQQVAETAKKLASAHEQQAALKDRLEAAKVLLEKRTQQLVAAQQRQSATQEELRALAESVARLELQIRESQQQLLPAQKLEHRITPIGRNIDGKELHFRVMDNRVALVPVEKLTERLKEQIERRKEWLSKSNSQLGQVGPVDGFTMHYTVERAQPSFSEELRYGPGVFRIGVSEWRIEADPGLVAEPVEKALKPGSRFYSALLQAEPDTALTFWVYPESFEGFGKLKAYCQTQNFLVAGRPLPTGYPIAGSPRGSKSSGQ